MNHTNIFHVDPLTNLLDSSTGLIVWYTCSYLEFLKELEVKVEQDWSGISSSLEEIRRTLLNKKGCLVNLTADGKNLKNSEKYVGKFLDLLPSTSLVTPASWNARIPSTNEAIVIPTQVSLYLYVLKSGFLFRLFITKFIFNHYR